MMRLQRTGRKNNPSYRVVVTDKRNGPRAGNHVDTIGSYNPKAGDFQIDADKAKHWLSKGVQPSDTLYNFLVTNGIVEGKKRNVLPKKSPIVSETPEEEKKEEAPAEAAPEAKEEAPTEEAAEEKTEEAKPEAEEEKKEEAPTEEKKEESATEAEEVKEETPAETKEEPAEEEKKEDTGEEKQEEETKN